MVEAQQLALGIDIGGSGMKAAPVDLATGEQLAERYRILTPKPATPESMVKVVKALGKHFDWKGPVGCAFPGVVRNGKTLTAANLDQRWVGVDAAKLFNDVLPGEVRVTNDADAAGVAEMSFGAGVGCSGTTMMITLGTGIGSALFSNQRLVPNTELGHLKIGKRDAEDLASSRARDDLDLSWKDWGDNLNVFLGEVERILSVERFIIGGGVSSKFEKFADRLKLEAEVVPAKLRNSAGIVGAALVHAQSNPE
ncbi:MAG: ROK family protein [Acidimicrobiales bacterium]